VLSCGACAGQAGAAATADGSTIIELLGTAEKGYFKLNGRYAPLGDILSSPILDLAAVQKSEYLSALQHLDRKTGSDPAPGFKLDLVVSPTGSNFKLSVTKKAEGCAPAWFADDSGAVYEGTTVECKTTETVASAAVPPLPPASPDPASEPAPRVSVLPPPPPLSVPSRNWAPPDIDQIIPPVKTDESCPLETLLRGASQHAEELVENLQRFSAIERIEHVEYGKDGKKRNSQSRTYNYVAQIESNPSGSLRVQEYRESHLELPATPLADTGTGAFALVFHPKHIENFDFRCEGKTESRGVPAWQVRFEEKPDPMKAFHAIKIETSTYPLRFKGRAWLDAKTMQVLRLETDLVAAIQPIQLQLEHLEITYAPVEFRKKKLTLWLPETATLYIGYRGRRYQRVHTFSRFQLFSVDTGQSVKEPPAIPAGPGF
jgi:hypothetical protein